MSTFKMGLKNFFVFTALLLLWKVCRVYGQATRVDYISQPCTSSVATTVQATPHLVVPAIFTPVVSPYDSYIQESVPNVPSYNGFNGYANYAPSYSQPMPPIIIEDDNNNNWQNILFLLFAMRNKKNCGSGNFGGCSGGCNSGCGCGGGCNGCCGCGGKCGGNCGGGYDNSDCCCCGKCCCCCGNCCCGNCCCCCDNCCCCPHIPYPIPYPINGAYPYSSSYSEDTYQPGKGNNDITLRIITDSSCSC